MLYEPKWEQKAKTANLHSIENLIAWLERQPCDGTYDFTNPSACLLGQYLRAHGEQDYHYLGSDAAGAFFGDDGYIIHSTRGMRGSVNRDLWSFGRALERAREIHSARR